MVKLLWLTAITVAVSSCSQKTPDDLVLVKGGAFVNTRSNFYGKGVTLPDFYIGKYEVTQEQWSAVMGNNPSKFKGDKLPVETVSWYDCIEFCNKRSKQEGLPPYYHINKDKKDPANTNALDNIKWTVTINANANGYRLPTETEWEYAAGGGQLSKSYPYSGGPAIDETAWYWKNSGDQYLTGTWSWPLLLNNNNKTHPVGSKHPNELGLYDMSGNVREWCWDWQQPNGNEAPPGRIWKGGGWMGADFCCESSFRASYEATGKGPDQGLRLCRNSQPPGQ
jgi:formylglycine-generating enzyme required for sulfatase activity